MSFAGKVRELWMLFRHFESTRLQRTLDDILNTIFHVSRWRLWGSVLKGRMAKVKTPTRSECIENVLENFKKPGCLKVVILTFGILLFPPRNMHIKAQKWNGNLMQEICECWIDNFSSLLLSTFPMYRLTYARGSKRFSICKVVYLSAEKEENWKCTQPWQIVNFSCRSVHEKTLERRWRWVYLNWCIGFQLAGICERIPLCCWKTKMLSTATVAGFGCKFILN